MSASAGRILLLPKGAYDASTTYNLLDMVFYQGSTYVAKQTTTGNLPTNTTYWQILAQGTQSAQVAGNYYGTCDTAAATAAKVVTIPAIENFVLQIGDIIGVKFDYDNTANNVTLNVNNTGAKHIYYNNAQLTTDNLFAGGEEDRITVYMYDGTNWVWIGHDIDEAGSSTGGVPIRLIIESEEGSTVTITLPDGVTTVTAIHMAESGHWYHDFYGPEAYGTYRIDAVLNGDDAVAYQVVDDCKIYVVDDAHFHANITVTYPTGATVTCSKPGETTQYASGSPYTFVVHSTGTYTIEGTRNGISESQTVTITTDGQSESVTLTILPDGSTITPTDDVQKLLQCADIWNKTTYTTIAQVINDADVLLKVLTTDNSIDYLVRSTTFASDICADEDAMSMIGSYDYVSNTLLADSDWLDGILASSYKDSVFNITNPTMTDNTHPSGECIQSSNVEGQPAYKAFDKNVSTSWSASGAIFDNTQYVGYKFTSPVKLYGVSYKARVTSNFIQQVNVKYQVSDTNNNDWIDSVSSFALQTFALTNVETITKFTSVATKQYVRLLFGTVSSGTSAPYPTAVDLRFYGRCNGGIQSWLKAGGITDKAYTTLAEIASDSTTLIALVTNANAINYLKSAYGLIDGICANETIMKAIGSYDACAEALLSDETWTEAIANSAYSSYVINYHTPTMTSNTTPSGVASANGSYTTYVPWKAFDKDSSTSWGCGSTGANQWIQYQFPTAFKCKMITYNPANVTRMSNMVLKVSNDGSDFDTPTLTFDLVEITEKKTVWADNNTAYSYYRMNFSANDMGGGFRELDFWGRVDSGVQSWLRAGGITDKTYTTLAEVLADGATLNALLSDNDDAYDYLVTAYGLVDGIVADSTAMGLIGLDNYGANLLLGDATWVTAIGNSTYFESVLNLKIPTMTSNTTPSGTVSASSIYGGYQAYYALDGNSSTYCHTQSNPGWLAYAFPEAVKIYKAVFGRESGDGYCDDVKAYDGSSWVSICTFNRNETTPSAIITNPTAYSKYKWDATNTLQGYVRFYDGIQLYGRQDV